MFDFVKNNTTEEEFNRLYDYNTNDKVNSEIHKYQKEKWRDLLCEYFDQKSVYQFSLNELKNELCFDHKAPNLGPAIELMLRCGIIKRTSNDTGISSVNKLFDLINRTINTYCLGKNDIDYDEYFIYSPIFDRKSDLLNGYACYSISSPSDAIIPEEEFIQLFDLQECQKVMNKILSKNNIKHFKGSGFVFKSKYVDNLTEDQILDIIKLKQYIYKINIIISLLESNKRTPSKTTKINKANLYVENITASINSIIEDGKADIDYAELDSFLAKNTTKK